MAEVLTKEEGSLSVSTENLLPIIKKWLYSEHDIFLRELVSNAYDAIMKLKQLKLEGVFEGDEPDYQIEIAADKEKKTLSIRDNGIGMDADEIRKYINQIAFSGAREFVATYQKVKDQNSLIGHFGLGFYSSFMTAKEVEVKSKSFKKGAQAVHWQSDGSIKYSLEPAEKETNGTEIILHLLDDSLAFLEKEKIKNTIRKYSNFLPIKIMMDGEQINSAKPLWAFSPNELKDEDYIQFYKELFPGEFEPLFWVHLKTDYPFELRGILYFPKLIHELDATKGNIKLFVNNVFVADKLKEITPEFLSVLMGALDSADIPLNVSRSQLQGDPNVKKISSYVIKKVAEKLEELFNKDRKKYEEIWAEINGFIKFGCISENSFYEKMKKAVLFKTLEKEWISLDEYVEKNKEKNKNKAGKTLVLYLNEDKENSSFEALLKENGLHAVYTNSMIDSHFIDFLERQNQEIQFASADSDTNDIFLDQIAILDENKSKQIQAVFSKYLEAEGVQVEVKNFREEKFPAMLIASEHLRRLQEMSTMMMGKKTIGGFLKDSLWVNAKSPLISKVLLMDTANAEKAKETANYIYDIASLSAGKLKGERLAEFVKKSIEMIKD